jgi:CRISPR-associated protein Csm4
MSIYAVYLRPKSAYRTALRSDTLWGLLMVAARAIYGEQKVLSYLEATQEGEPPFILSSTFPYKSEQGKLSHFFPKPFLKPFSLMPTSIQEMNKLKAYKRVKWLEQGTYEAFLNGLSEKNFFEKEAWQTESGVEIKRALNLHTSIDPLSGTTREIEGQGQLFWSEDYFMDKNTGLFFLVRGEEFLEWEGALRFLQHFGFGGDNSSGRGFFEYEIKPFQIKVPATANHLTSLSLYSPTTLELQSIRSKMRESFYELVTRKGRVGTHFVNQGDFQKEAVVCFSEGATFPLQSALGKLQVVKKVAVHDIFHNGLAFTLPISIAH